MIETKLPRLRAVRMCITHCMSAIMHIRGGRQVAASSMHLPACI